jgi:hypothetical protein
VQKGRSNAAVLFGDTKRGIAGAARGIRTPDPVITNDVLYQLSYCGNPRSEYRATPVLARRSGGSGGVFESVKTPTPALLLFRGRERWLIALRDEWPDQAGP